MLLPSRPFRIEFEITGRCNLKCQYCLAMPFSRTDPPLENLLDLFRRTRDEVEPFEIVITGGEPFLRRDIMIVLEGAADIFGKIGITTNGTRLKSLSRKDLTALQRISGERGRLQVSLDSKDLILNDSIRGCTADVLNGLEILERADVPFCIGAVVTKHNLPSLPSTLEFLLRKHQLMRGVAFMNLMPSETLGRDSWLRLVAGADEYRNICDTTLRMARTAGRSYFEIYTDKQNEQIASELDRYGIPFCLAGLTKMEVLPNGDVTPCSMIRSVTLGNIYKESWSGICARSHERLSRMQQIGTAGAQCISFNRNGSTHLHEPSQRSG